MHQKHLDEHWQKVNQDNADIENQKENRKKVRIQFRDLLTDQIEKRVSLRFD